MRAILYKLYQIFKQFFKLILGLFKKKNFFSRFQKINDPRVLYILNQLRINGYYVIEDYKNEQECELLLKEIDRIINENSNSKFYPESNDYRIYFADRKSSLITKFNVDKFLNEISNSFYNEFSSAFFTLAGLIYYKDNVLGSGGDWHRDIALPGQFKTMLYLSDVNENGPFEYIKGTQKDSSLFYGIWNCNLNAGAYRLNSKSVNSFLKSSKFDLVTFKAKKGTLIIFDSFGIHRGSPLKNGKRYALTNYYFKDKFINKNKSFLENKFKL